MYLYLIPIIFLVVGVSVLLFSSKKPDANPKFRKIIETAASPAKKKKRNTAQGPNETANANAIPQKNKKDVTSKSSGTNEKKSNDDKKLLNPNSPKQKENASNNTGTTNSLAKIAKNKSVKNNKIVKSQPNPQLSDDDGEWQTVITKKQKKQTADSSPTNGAKNVVTAVTKQKVTKSSPVKFSAVESPELASVNEPSPSFISSAPVVEATDIGTGATAATTEPSVVSPVENSAAFDELGDILLTDTNVQKKNKKRSRKE